MDNFQQKKVLDSFEIIVDTREQPTKRAKERYRSFDAPYRIQTLNYGDYTYNLTFPTNQSLFPPDQRISGICCVERKQNLDELAMCFTRSRDRFRKEFERAVDNNAKMFLLVENASYEMLLAGQYRSKFKPKAFLASLMAWQARYGFSVVMCEMQSSGRLIKEILYRDAKERLEREEFVYGEEDTNNSRCSFL